MDSKFIHEEEGERDSVCPVIDRIENVSIFPLFPLSSDVSVFGMTRAYVCLSCRMHGRHVLLRARVFGLRRLTEALSTLFGRCYHGYGRRRTPTFVNQIKGQDASIKRSLVQRYRNSQVLRLSEPAGFRDRESPLKGRQSPTDSFDV
ncbi:hypothetical protein NL676_016922 [Syzygium grande]|nr:hypothetical protein NL676_016922 [Syzygium grande]